VEGFAASIAPFAQISAVGALLFVLVLLFRAVSAGDWVPRRELDYLRADRDARLLEARNETAEWRAAAETERHRADIAVEQSGQLLAVSGTLTRTLDALRAHAEGGDRHAAP
jgi:hypothetical protein